MKDIILLPTYNEKENVELIIPEIFSILPEIYILVIDDNSPDGTADAVKKLMDRYSNLSILERQTKDGLGEAYKAGIKKVILDNDLRSIISMDADGSHSPEYLKNLLNNINDNDLIIGSRYMSNGGVENWESWRRNLSKFGNLYANILTGIKVKDLTSGFVCYRRDLLEKVNFHNIGSSGYAYQIEMKSYLINNLKAKYKEIPIIFKSRREGESKISNQIISEGLKVPWKIFYKRIWKK